MISFGTTILDILSLPIVQGLLAILVTGLLTGISLIKFYAYISCGYYRVQKAMDGKTVVITGANGGIGRETARELAKRGARVIMACRNTESAASAKDDIVATTKNQNIVVKKLNLSSQKSVREFAEDIIRTEPRIDVLIHNAGTAESKIQITEDNLELTMATNHYGPYLLTHLLIDHLKKSSPSRIVIVASELYRFATLNLNKINPTTSWFPPYIYYVSKYANIYFSSELARRLDGTGITVNCLHPGMIDSGIWRNVPVPLSWFMQVLIKGFFKTPQQGCQTSVYLACADEVDGITGRYFMDCKEHGLSSGARDASKAKKFWELSEKLVDLRNTDPKI